MSKIEEIDPLGAFACIMAFGTEDQKQAALDGFKQGVQKTNKAEREIADAVKEAIKEMDSDI